MPLVVAKVLLSHNVFHIIMQESNLEIQNTFEKVLHANERIFQNYLENFSGYSHDMLDMATTYSHFVSKILIDPTEIVKLQNNYLQFLDKQQQLFAETINRNDGKLSTPVIKPHEGDRRFKAPEWNDEPLFDYIKQSYLLVSELMRNVIDDCEIDEKEKKKLLFFTNQHIDAFSPSNFVATNPEVLKKAKETNGESLKEGFLNLLTDIEKGRITQTDETAFEVGKNLAITLGAVVYQNDLIQLIQYSPAGETVYEVPLLLIPPWINKYYILDLQPENSFARYAVERGNTVFMISWKNPTKKLKNFTFDDYVEKGVLVTIEVIKNITGSEKVNTLGFCLGGTLLGVVLSIMATRRDESVQSATFLASMLDFTDVGPMGDVIDQAMVKKLERGELQLEGVMHGHAMGKAFNLIRPNDLIWNYVVDNYLKGNKPTAFDVLFWTNDNTNLPANMYIYYMRHMILGNKLSRKNALRICNTPISLGKIKVPSLVIAMREDHISPPQTVFTTTELLSGPVEFILGDSGHVMGVANPPSRKKYGYSKSENFGHGFEAWKEEAKHFNGSWWKPWSDWLTTQSGEKIKATTQLGNKKYKIIENAPGTFVKEKCKICLEEFF